jgi:predicted 3-demethylubiquinone-9 3-methyltransferase (glyoxalase superfamily)
VFGDLSENGQVQMPLTKTFFSPKFGMVADKFGVSWMVIVNRPATRTQARTSSSRACSMRRASWSGRPSPIPSA